MDDAGAGGRGRRPDRGPRQGARRPAARQADKVERWAIDRLIPYAKNARTHTDAQVAAIAASIKEWPWDTEEYANTWLGSPPPCTPIG